MGRRRSKSRSRSRSHSRSRRRRSSSSDSSGSRRPHRSSDYKSRKRSRERRSRSRERRSRSRNRRSRSRERHSRSRSGSRSRDRRRRRSRSRERRSRRSRSRERWPRSRSRSRERRRRGNRSSRSRSDSRSRRRHRSRSSSHDSNGMDKRKASFSRHRSPGRKGSSSEDKPNQSSSMGDLSSEIPGYANMTPSERVKAKLKLMLEKTSDKMNREEDKAKEHQLSIALPSAADIAKIEGDAFEPASFVSHRVAKKQEMKLVGGGGKKHFDVTSVDPSEYEPQVVELSEQLIQESEEDCRMEQTADGEKDKSNNVTMAIASSTTDIAQPVASKNARWLSKLQKLRQQFTTPPKD